ncbi:MAG TPA: uroporphyrinogen decarboxylase [Candidatus Dormibacteraeota bacterium]|nr:uroporphyrinogen decarboxylase [Candidatus Dormibacteraeota bacterium]
MSTTVQSRSKPEKLGTIPDSAPAANRTRFLNACHCRSVDRAPVWLMRQAGRALPEYRALKQKHTFLQLVQTPELATEVTLQPVRRFDFDAAILFSDILVVAEGLGQKYQFRDQGGIEMEFLLKTAADVDRLEVGAVRDRLSYVEQALSMLKQALAGRTALLGFAGSPWTLANFMLEGGGVKEYSQAKALFYSDPRLFSQLLEKLTAAVTDFLLMQIEAGADAVQIFDSLGGVLNDSIFAEASARWMKQIVTALGSKVPVIVFSKGTHGCWDSLIDTGAQILGVDWNVRLSDVASTLPKRVAVQGNLDPIVLTTTPEIVAKETQRILDEMAGRPGHIFNLGHGVPPAARLENIEALVTTVRNSSKNL